METYVPHGNPILLEKYKMVAIVRKDLEMNRGKIAAQVGHGFVILTVRSMTQDSSRRDILQEWLDNGMRKVVLKAPDLATLESIAIELREANLPFVLVKDAGLTQVDPGTITCLVVGPCTTEEIDSITGNLKLLS